MSESRHGDIVYFIQIYHVWEGYLRKIPVLRLNFPRRMVIQIYHVWEGYLRKIPVLRLNFPRLMAREI